MSTVVLGLSISSFTDLVTHLVPVSHNIENGRFAFNTLTASHRLEMLQGLRYLLQFERNTNTVCASARRVHLRKISTHSFDKQSFLNLLGS